MKEDNLDKQTFIKIKGQKFPYQALDVERKDGWISFNRFNTKTGEVVGHMEFPLESVESVETR